MRFCNIDEVSFESRIDEGCAPEITAYDCDGEYVARFYGEWTESQMRHALEIANRAYEIGSKTGASMKTREIRRALGIRTELE